jgi:tetratricopeptide (TPR) repeat protein
MKTLLFFSFLFLFTNKKTTNADLISEGATRQFVESYFSRLSVYGSNPSKANSNELELLNMHYDPDEPNYPNDLGNNIATTDFSNYLIDIRDVYNHKVNMDYTIKNVSACETSNQGFAFTFVFVTKTMMMVGNVRKIEILVSVSNSSKGTKIHRVDWLSTEIIKNDACLSNELKKEDKEIIAEATTDKFMEIKKNGDNAFSTNNYRVAKECYEEALKVKNDNYLLEQIKICNNQITCQTDIKLAEDYTQKKEYKKSINILNKITSNCPKYKNKAIEKINFNSDLIKKQNYEHYLKIGDDLFTTQLYTNAKNAYLKALEFSPNNDYILKQISICEGRGAEFIQNEIRKAISLAENGKLANAFSIFYRYESSNLLDGDNYYFMAMVLDNNDGKVTKLFNLTRKERFHLAKIYCINAMNKGNINAENMYFEIFNKKSKRR